MPRRARPDLTNMVVHVVNRAVRRVRLFDEPADNAAFESILVDVHDRLPLRILAFCVMPNHWHLVAWPRTRDELSRFMHLLTGTHAGRWHAARATTGIGHVYQDRYKAFPVQVDTHVVKVCRHVERNALRANLVARAAARRWGSLWHWLDGDAAGLSSEWPIPRPRDWDRVVDEPQTEEEVEALRHAVRRGAPFGSPEWVVDTARDLGLDHTLRSPGGQRKSEPER